MLSTIQKFDAAWWNELITHTHNMTIPSIFKDCLEAEETALMRNYILDILAELAEKRTNKYGYRVYLDDILLKPEEMDFIYDHPPLSNESIEEWVTRTFKGHKFGMIINQAERFNLNLSKIIALKLKPFLESAGMPTEGVIFTLFLGNYDSTPLGIHMDMPGKSVIHFHLGPGSKTMYTWDNEEYVKLTGEKAQNNKEIDKYLPLATEHTFQEGDLYFMPENIYHIGTQTGLSIGIACWFYNRSNYHFANRLSAILLENHLKNSNDMLKPDKSPLDASEGLEKTLELYDLPEEYESLSFKDLLKETYRNLRYSLHSNAGYRTSPFPITEEITFNENDIIVLEYPYQIMLSKSLNPTKLNMYVRGVKVELNNFECLTAFVEELNKGKEIKIADLLKYLDESWPVEHGLYLLGLIAKFHGIRTVNQEI